MRIWSQMKYSVWTIVLLDAEPEDKHSNLLSHNLLHLPGAKQHINTCTTKQISFHQKPYHDSRAENHSLKNLTQFDTQSQTRNTRQFKSSHTECLSKFQTVSYNNINPNCLPLYFIIYL